MKYTELEENGVTIYEISGYLKGRPKGYEFLEMLRGRIAGGAGKIVVDLGGVERMDSSGIGIIASIITSAENAGSPLCFCNVEGKVLQLLEMVGITRVIECGSCRDEAVSKLKED